MSYNEDNKKKEKDESVVALKNKKREIQFIYKFIIFNRNF